MEWYYAIEIIGYGTCRRFVIKDIQKNGDISYTLHPVHGGRRFRTEDAARRYAADHGYEIAAIGDFYQILL